LRTARSRSSAPIFRASVNGQNWVGKLIVLIAIAKIAPPPERKTIEAPPPPPSKIDPPPREDDIGDLDPEDEIPF
jgi:hypothetical protein